MAQKQGGSSDGAISWFIIVVAIFGLFGGLMWLVASNYIVYYLSPILSFLAKPYSWLPTDIVGTAANDVSVQHYLNRWHPNQTGLLDWIGFVNLTLKPTAILFAFVVGLLFVWMLRGSNKHSSNRVLTPLDLATQLSTVFSETAPVIRIQSELVADKLPEWKKQTFPEEFVKAARYQRKKVLVIDPRSKDRKLIIDENRMHGYLSQVRALKVGEISVRFNKFLGRQIVDIIRDSKIENPVFPDRLSDTGKAVFAILAPYAFGGPKGRAASISVKDALNYSAFGSPNGMANLSVPVVSQVYEQWKGSPLVHKLAKIYHWEHTFLSALLEAAQRNGKVGTFQFIWLKPMNRQMFYALNTVGRKTPATEAGLSFSQLQYERRCARAGRLPLTATGEPVIFTKKVIEALSVEWEEWRDGDDDDDQWWKEDGLLDWDKNEELMRDLLSAATPVSVPDIL